MTTPLVYEVVVSRFKPKAGGKEDQVALMRRLDPLMRKVDGLIELQLLYSEPDNRWISYLVWRDVASADHSFEVAKQPEYAAIFDLVHRTDMVWTRADHLNDIGVAHE